MVTIITCLRRFIDTRLCAWTFNLLAISVLLVYTMAATLADPVVPSAIDYDFEGKDTPTTETCGIVMTIAAGDSSEIVNFRLQARLDKASTDMTIGFTVNAGVLVNRPKQTSGVMVMKLKAAQLQSRNFDTAKHLVGGVSADGGVEMRSGLPTDAGAFYRAFIDEPYILRITPEGSPGAHEFAIVPHVPESVQQTFQRCLDAL